MTDNFRFFMQTIFFVTFFIFHFCFALFCKTFVKKAANENDISEPSCNVFMLLFRNIFHSTAISQKHKNEGKPMWWKLIKQTITHERSERERKILTRRGREAQGCVKMIPGVDFINIVAQLFRPQKLNTFMTNDIWWVWQILPKFWLKILVITSLVKLLNGKFLSNTVIQHLFAWRKKFDEIDC